MLAPWCPYTWNQVTGQRVVNIYFSLSLLLCRRQGFFGRASLRQETVRLKSFYIVERAKEVGYFWDKLTQSLSLNPL